VTQSAMLPTDVGAALSLQEFLDSWEDDPPPPLKTPMPAEKAQRLQTLVTRATQMAGVLKIAWATGTQEGSVWETGSYVRRVQTLEFLARVVVDSFTRTQEIVARTRVSHPEWIVPPDAAEVLACLPSVREIWTKAQELSVWLHRKRPPLNKEMVLRSQESLSRDEGEPLGDVITRLEDGGRLVKE
jgi:hypothetical protein